MNEKEFKKLKQELWFYDAITFMALGVAGICLLVAWAMLP